MLKSNLQKLFGVAGKLVQFLVAVFLFAIRFAVADEVSFNRDIRPILAESCFYCHGQDANKRQADLRLDLRDAAVDYGAIEPGNAKTSLLVERIFSEDPDSVMPPPDSNRILSSEQKELLKQWIAQGAKYETHWAFSSPTRSALPSSKNQDWIRNPIDTFVLAKLESIDIRPSPEADRPTLIKRLYSDLIGLPPTPDEVSAFINDSSPYAYEQLVDRLLANPHFGERLALPWLDAARYADSNGFQQDGDTWQWMWRDWVVKSLNEDLPFNQFTIWQLAGDLLPDATVEQKIASGFNRNHLLNGEGGAIAEEQRFNVLFDRVDTTATTWLGLTMACAQCHDHKYDPITQKDYYRLLDAFNKVPETGVPKYFSARIRVGEPVLELPTAENLARIAELETQIAELKPKVQTYSDALFAAWRAGIEADGSISDATGLPEDLLLLLAIPADERNEEQSKTIETTLRKHFEKSVRAKLQNCADDDALASLNKSLSDYRADQIPRPMIMSDAQERKSHILDRGEYLKPLDEVSFETPEFLSGQLDSAPRNRLGFAEWLFAAEHPLTARVQVNRMWQYYFGTGIVKTAEDFGVQSEYPTHKQLLDWLAVEFRESGWSQKHMHRLILTSATYRQSSKMNEWHVTNDPENRLLARASRIRMPSMVLRDWALSSSGLLNASIGGSPVYPYQPDAVWEALAITKERDFTYPASTGNALYRRSLYTFWRRTVGPTNMFDSSNRQTCRVRASLTSTPLHALTTLNDPTWIEAARALAERAIKTEDEDAPRLVFAFQQVLCRQPHEGELEILASSYKRQIDFYNADQDAAESLLRVGATPRDATIDAVEHAALTAVCIGILNFDEALVRE